MPKIKILWIVESLSIGGLEKVVINLALKLDKNKYKHIFCCLHKKGDWGEELQNKGIKVYELHKKPGLGLELIPKIRKIIKRENIDIIHTHNSDAFHNAIPASFFIRNLIMVHTDHNSFARLESRKVLVYNWFLTHFAHKIITVSNSVKTDWIKQIGGQPKKLITIHNGIDIDKFEVRININKEKVRLQLNENHSVIGIIARLSEEKDHYTLLKSFKDVNKKIKEVILLIIGDGPLRKDLEDFAKKINLKNVRFLGKRKDIPRLLKLLDVFVLSSLSEGCSQAILEAMAAAKPVVATNVGGNPELVKNYETGILVAKQDPFRLSEAIIKLLRNKKLRETMGKQGRKRVKKYFTLEQQAKNYERVYTELIQSKFNIK